MKRSSLLLGLVFLWAGFLSSAFAQDEITIPEEYRKTIQNRGAIEALEKDIFGEQVSLYTGALEFVQNDVSLPGNNSLVVAAGRRFTPNHATLATNGLFADWDLEIPHLHGVFAVGWVVPSYVGGPDPQSRCTNFQAPPNAPSVTGDAYFSAGEYWHGNFFYMPGRGDSEMLVRNPATPKPSTGTYPVNTKDGTVFRCIPLASTSNGSGEGFEAVLPDGTHIFFDHMVSRPYETLKKAPGPADPLTGGAEGGDSAPSPEGGDITPMTATESRLLRKEFWILPSRIEDRFGNWVAYNWGSGSSAHYGWKLNSITSSDNRQITFGYLGGTPVTRPPRISSVSYGAHTWTYAYSGERLTGATRPDGRAWTFDLEYIRYMPQYVDGGECSYAGMAMYGPKTGTMTHPEGALGSFTLSPVLQGRSWVQYDCATGTDKYPFAFYTAAISSRRYDGLGLPSTGLNWTYSYGPANACYKPNPFTAACTANSPTTRTITVTDPGNSVTRYTFGNKYQYTEGQLQQVDEGWNGTSALRTTLNQYAGANDGPYPSYAGTSPQGGGDSYFNARYMPLKRADITVVGTAATHTYTTLVNSFDTLARRTSETRSNTAGATRTDTRTYHDNVALYVIGQVRSRTNANTGLVESLVDYGASSVKPEAVRTFGLLRRSATYRADGTLATIADGLSRATTYANWKRGIPQLVTYADSSSSSATISDLGWIDDLRDENGNVYHYGYDSLGRLTSETYPTVDVWAPRGISYEAIPTAEFNVPAGSLRARETVGRRQVSTYYDALLRPVLIAEEDTDTGERIFTQKSYDALARSTFTSYPSTTYTSVVGVREQYDVLGRLESRTATGPNSFLLETREYRSGHSVKVTDADGRATTVTYQAFGEPSYSIPVTIQGEENQTTTISRDVFGKMLSVTQSGAWSGGTASHVRSFGYDAYQRLCRRQELESSTTLWGYNTASEVTWEVLGTSGACVAEAPAVTNKQYTYDARGRKIKDTYLDPTENVTYVYDAAGNLKSVGNVVSTWTYAYNSRNLLESEQAQVGAKTFVLDPHYNDMGHVDSLITPTSTFAYDPDAWGRPTKIGTHVQGIDYHPNGLTSAYTFGNGLVHQQTLDSQRRIESQTIRDGLSNLQSYAYEYTNGGDLLALNDVLGGDSLDATYDNLHRLKTATGLWGTYGYIYDTLNNLRKRTGPSQLTYQYSSNRITSVSGGHSRTYSYTGEGYVAGDGVRTFVLNGRGQIQTVLDTANLNRNTRYFYDGNGRRILTVRPSGELEYSLYNKSGQLVYTEKSTADGNNVTKADYLSLDHHTVAELRHSSTGTTPVYFLTDLIGSPRRAFNSSKGTLWSEHYDPYGDKLNGVVEKLGYAGHVNDPESGLTYMQARFYDPQVGRFLSTDPVHFKDEDPFTFNRYAYANNNPYRYTDPTGMNPESEPEKPSTAATKGTTTGAENANAANSTVGVIATAGEAVGKNNADIAKTAATFESAEALAKGSKALGTFTVALQPVISTAVAVQQIDQGRDASAAAMQATVDVEMGLVGLIPPWGTAASVTYSAITVNFPEATDKVFDYVFGK